VNGQTQTQGQQATQGQAKGQAQGGGYKLKGFPGSRDDIPYDAAGLGSQLAKSLGTTSYTDPNTGHVILNPGGSGEQAMGVTRDLGPPVAPAKAQAPTSAQNPPASVSAPPLPQSRPFGAGAAPFPFAPDAAGLLAPPKDTDFASRTMDLPFASMKQPFGSAMPLSPFAVPQTMPPPQPFPPGQEPTAFASRFQGTTLPQPEVAQPQLPAFNPLTVQQQMLGLSPFSTGFNQTEIPSVPLLPWQWPQGVGWPDFNVGWGGFGGFGDFGAFA